MLTGPRPLTGEGEDDEIGINPCLLGPSERGRIYKQERWVFLIVRGKKLIDQKPRPSLSVCLRVPLFPRTPFHDFRRSSRSNRYPLFRLFFFCIELKSTGLADFGPKTWFSQKRYPFRQNPIHLPYFIF